MRLHVLIRSISSFLTPYYDQDTAKCPIVRARSFRLTSCLRSLHRGRQSFRLFGASPRHFFMSLSDHARPRPSRRAIYRASYCLVFYHSAFLVTVFPCGSITKPPLQARYRCFWQGIPSKPVTLPQEGWRTSSS